MTRIRDSFTSIPNFFAMSRIALHNPLGNTDKGSSAIRTREGIFSNATPPPFKERVKAWCCTPRHNKVSTRIIEALNMPMMIGCNLLEQDIAHG